MESKTATLIATAAILLLMTVAASAQQNTGTILGVVKDSSGALVPGAGITILNDD